MSLPLIGEPYKKGKSGESSTETIECLREALATMNTKYMQVKIELDETITEYSKLKAELKQKESGDRDRSKKAPSKVLNQFQKFRSTMLSGKARLQNGIKKKRVTENGDSKESDENDNENNNDNDNESNIKTNENENENEHEHESTDNVSKENEDLRRERDELLVKYTEGLEQISRLREQSKQDADKMEELLQSKQQEWIEAKDRLMKEWNEKHEKELSDSKLELQMCKQAMSGQEAKLKEIEGQWEERYTILINERNESQKKVNTFQASLSSNQHAATHLTCIEDASAPSLQSLDSWSQPMESSSVIHSNHGLEEKSESTIAVIHYNDSDNESVGSSRWKVQELNKDKDKDKDKDKEKDKKKGKEKKNKKKKKNGRNQFFSMIQRLATQHTN
ncbi:myb domain-containing protein, partial [Reticulomyxa filosa]